MAFVCGISGEIPQVPAISLISKTLFEKRLLEKWVEEYGTDPLTKEAMTMEDIIEIKIQPIGKPRIPSATSIPQILQLLQDEWDSTMLFTHKLAQNLSNTKKELYTTLYQKDAACRVIARQLNEMAELEDCVKNGIQTKTTTNDDAIDTEMTSVNEESLDEKINENIQSTAKSLITNRKKMSKSTPLELATSEAFKSIHQIYENNSLHSPREGKLFSLDLKSNSEFVVTAGADKNLVLFDKESERVFNKIKAHSKRINHVQFHPDSSKELILSCSVDHDISIWNYTNESNSSALKRLKIHKSTVVGFDIHPYSDYLLSGEQKYTWNLTDLNSLKVIRTASLAETMDMGCIKCHPDGLIFAGTNTSVSSEKIFIWDICSGENVAKFSGNDGEVLSIDFSENGYHFCALQKNNNEYFVSLWDLRKLKSVKDIVVDSSFNPNTLTYDKSGHYLAVGGNGFMVYNTKTWELIGSLEIPKSQIHCLKFAKEARSIVSVGFDRYLRYFSV